MKLLPVAFALISSCTTASAVDFRWTLGYGQGTLEANIENAAGSTFSIYCPAGSDDKTPGMFISATRIKPQVKESITAQIIIDGKNHPFLLEGSQFKAEGRQNQQDFRQLVIALATTKQKSFVVEFPKYQTQETFSLLDVRKTLGTAKKTIIRECDDGT
ncbi:hypothetical protein G8O24_03070 [Bradyrhizobium sp. INPA01-394B]|uniref:Uncharacterized protein n=1 Tax=Bradyrhizobium campsiandrae TaxID=1729892 RepID=A0ABR7U7X6_9BRAD|nr:hypothetical protein [Bradyrhizobium campsiandrae]MBC9876327.1 hypothetical protein [Bradyrhizobium campsiandrae]MBC9980150.1 hypothetical protein [Bradyrhizobium campsiandrae]